MEPLQTTKQDGRTVLGSISRRWDLLLLLLAATLVMVVHAQRDMLISDELLVYYTTVQPTVSAELHFQRTMPMVVEPPAYDLLVRGSWALFGGSGLALRLPSVLSLLLLMAALYLLLAEVSGRRAAFTGTLLVMFFRLIDYGWQARPYAFVLAMVAVAALCWYRATRPGRSRCKGRIATLSLLFLSLALAINSHYFGVFALAAFLLAEAVRTARRRALDIPVSLALLGAGASALLMLPFLHGGMRLKGHTVYSIVNWSCIVRTYEWTLNFGGTLGKVHHGFGAFAAAMVAVAAVGSAWRLLPRGGTELWVLIAAILLMPVPAVVADMCFLHMYLPRYVIYENVGLILGLGVFVGPWLERMSTAAYAVFASVFFAACGVHQLHLRRESQDNSRAVVRSIPAPAPAVALLQQDPSALVFATYETCLFEAHYGTPLLQQRLRCVYDEGREMRYGHTNQVALTTTALLHLPGFQGITYGQMTAWQGPRILVESPEVWQAWLPESLEADGFQLSPMGPGMVGSVFLISAASTGVPMSGERAVMNPSTGMK